MIKNLRVVLALSFMLLCPSFSFAATAVPSWTGFYVGGHIGAMWGDFENSAPAIIGPDGTGGGFSGGAHVGYNFFQAGSFVLGAETDFSFIDVDASSPASAFEEDWVASFRGRVGYALGQFMPFVTAGLALTGSESSITGIGSDTTTHTGFTAGAGVEMQLSEKWSARGEYVYVDVPLETTTIGAGSVRGGSSNHGLRAGLSFHF